MDWELYSQDIKKYATFGCLFFLDRAMLRMKKTKTEQRKKIVCIRANNWHTFAALVRAPRVAVCIKKPLVGH